MRQLVNLLADKVTATTAIGARPALVTDGVDIKFWRSGSGQFPFAAVFIDGTLAAAVSAPGGGLEGVELWGYVLGQWWLIGSLHSGTQINIAGDTQGWSQTLQSLNGQTLGDYERLAVAGTVSAGAATAKFAPMETWG